MPAYVCGLDLGQVNDPSALVIVERREDLGYDPSTLRTVTSRPLRPNPWERAVPTVEHTVVRTDGTVGDVPEPTFLSYDLRHAARFPLSTPYPHIVKDVSALLNQPPLRDNVTLVIDATGVGRPVCDLFTLEAERHYATVNVIITGGNATTRDEDTGYWSVPKRDLVGVVQVALQNKRLRFPESKKLPVVDVLAQELQNFKVKINAQTAHDSYGEWRTGMHDDLVLALALALWQAERGTDIKIWHL
jgi:hypothetical protein